MSAKDRRDAIKYQNQQSKTGAKIPPMAEALAAVLKKREDDKKPKVR